MSYFPFSFRAGAGLWALLKALRSIRGTWQQYFHKLTPPLCVTRILESQNRGNIFSPENISFYVGLLEESRPSVMLESTSLETEHRLQKYSGVDC